MVAWAEVPRKANHACNETSLLGKHPVPWVVWLPIGSRHIYSVLWSALLATGNIATRSHPSSMARSEDEYTCMLEIHLAHDCLLCRFVWTMDSITWSGHLSICLGSGYQSNRRSHERFPIHLMLKVCIEALDGFHAS
jgi:hypothetical protein